VDPNGVREWLRPRAPLKPDAPVLAGIVDRLVEPAELHDAALAEAERLAVLPAYRLVKEQLRRPTLEQLRRIVDHDEDPLLHGWISSS
jgi:hypothetical protein